MYNLYPYFTNDGSIGLFNPTVNDIYHSTTGAVTESWQKFIIPSHIENFIEQNDTIKILDICYGIGYNTKSALKIFEKKYFQNKNNKNKYKKNILPTNNISEIDTDNNLNQSCIDQIHADNQILKNKLENKFNKSNFLEKNTYKNYQYNGSIYSDNISSEKYKGILIDAVDTDKILMNLSPYILCDKKDLKIIGKNRNHFLSEADILKKLNLKSNVNIERKTFKNEYSIGREIEIIILESLLKNKNAYLNLQDEEDLIKIMTNKNYFSILDKYMINLSKFYHKWGYKCSSDVFKSTFLHNIYYRYISTSYKKAHELLTNNKIDVNFHNLDARDFVSASAQTYNFIFLDSFTPAKCPCLWSRQFFEKLYNILDYNGMILTYSNSSAVRHALLENKFFIGKIFNRETQKFMGTVASKNKNLIEYELSEQELGLINSKAGICFEDDNRSLDNNSILKLHSEKVKNSNLISSKKYLRGLIK